MGSVRIDPFFYKQPPLGFVEELRSPLHTQKPDWFGSVTPSADEVCAKGVFLKNEFPDAQGLLDTMLTDFDRFLAVYAIAGKSYPIHLVKAETECFEAYRISVEPEACRIEAGDTEGIRRALVYLEDEFLRRGGAVLPLGTISRKPSVRTRITRGFFSPTNRPPRNVDELMDDVDYYPEEYLNRLVHDGTNGIWIYTRFKDLLPSEVFPEYGENWERRITKLRSVVAKCKRFGIKVYVFGVEPAGLSPEMAEKYPDAIGYLTKDNNYTLCTHTEKGAAYCIEATQKLMELVPDLGGIIDITDGERFTSCTSAYHYERCPRCSRYSKGSVLAHTVNLFREGIRRAGSNAEFISWTYGHRHWDMPDIQDYVADAPADAMLMENFEDAGYTEQLGQTRQAMDYWLSYVGPSQMYEGAAEKALETQKQMFAKMQVCCSHELATVPYIPVPGILFDKYAAAREFKVNGVMQCWYFGNYPSLMSKAAGELSFMEDFSDKEAFLEHLAGIYCGRQGKEMLKAWAGFEEGYKNYPVNIMFSYYGPMHDGVVWDLALQPRNAALSRSWQLLDPPEGDRIGECLQSGHTLEEAVVLTEAMQKHWHLGMTHLPENTPPEQKNVAQTLAILLSSGHNILMFYKLRTQLLTGDGDPAQLLRQMKDIVLEEIRNSEMMIPLCENDPRLGYHSEAEGYKFFPEKLLDRIGKLQRLLDDFAKAHKRLINGQKAICWQPAAGEKTYCLNQASVEKISGEAYFSASCDEDTLTVELQGAPETAFMLYFEYQPLWPAPGIKIQNGELALANWALSHQCVFGEKIHQEIEKYHLHTPKAGHYVLTVDRNKAGWTKNEPIRVFVSADGVSWITDDNPVHTLGKADASPLEYGWFVPDGAMEYIKVGGKQL